MMIAFDNDRDNSSDNPKTKQIVRILLDKLQWKVLYPDMTSSITRSVVSDAVQSPQPKKKRKKRGMV